MVRLTEMLPRVVLPARAVVALLLMAMVFAPAGEGDLGELPPEPLRAEVLAAHVLTPTFDEGELTQDSGDSYEAAGIGQGTVRTLTPAVLTILLLASTALLLLARVRLLRRRASASRSSSPPLGSRAPPLLRLV